MSGGHNPTSSPATEAPGMVGSLTAARLAGVTYRQLHYWARNGYAPPSHVRTGPRTITEYDPDGDQGSGHAFLYDEAALRRLSALAVLVRAGFTVGTARRILSGHDVDAGFILAVELSGRLADWLDTAQGDPF